MKTLNILFECGEIMHLNGITNEQVSIINSLFLDNKKHVFRALDVEVVGIDFSKVQSYTLTPD